MSTHRLSSILLLAVSAIIVCAAGLAACGGSTPPPPPTVTVTASPSSTAPSVSPSATPPTVSKQLAIAVASGSATNGISVIGSAGQVKQLVAPHGGPVSDLAWSPDGTSLAFTAFSRTVETPKAPDLWVIGVDGTGLHLLARHASSPSWGTVVTP